MLFVESENAHGGEGDHQLFVCGHDDCFPCGVIGGDDAFFAEAMVVLLVVDADVESGEPFHDALADGEGVFADAAGEDEGVSTAEKDVVCADVLDDAADEHLDCEFSLSVAVGSGVHHVAHVAAVDSADAVETGLLVEDLVDFLAGVSEFDETEDGGGVEVAGTGSHHETFKRGESHCGVDDFSVFDSCHGAAVAEVAGDDGGVFEFLSEEFGGGEGHIVVAGSVEAVFADAVLFVVVIGDGIEVCFRGHGLVKLSVEDADVGDSGEVFFAGFDSGEVRGVVKRSEGEAFADDVLDFRRDFDRLGDFFAAVEDAVTDSGDFGEALDDADFRIDEHFADFGESFAVVCDMEGNLFLEAVGAFVDQIGGIASDTFDLSACENFIFSAFHVEKRVLEGGAAGIDN